MTGAEWGDANVDMPHEKARARALGALGLIVRYDSARKPDAPRWTVAIAGVATGHGFSPDEAAGALLRHLQESAHHRSVYG